MQPRPPQTQKAEARPISFVLDDTTSGAAPVSVSLVIRPEDLTRTDSSRIATHQTLGGAWVDNFGPGLPALTISGHTGWRRRVAGDDEQDGLERFQHLYEHVFTKWHERRADAIRAGQDPDRVRLVYADALDQFAVVVAPISFTLRRSKSRPLLCQYQIAMTVVSQDIDEIAYLQFGGGQPASADDLEASGLDSLAASIDEIAEHLRDVQSFIDRELVAPVRDFLTKTIRLYNAVSDAVRAADGIAASLIGVARMTAAAGMNIFRTIGAVTNLPSHIRGRLMQVSSAYSNIFCVLRNALHQQEYYPDYNPLFGASNCSSTAGGRPISPLSGVNPFYLYAPSTRQLPVTIAGDAQSSLQAMASSDVVLAPMSRTSLVGSLVAISNGMSVA